MVLTLSTWLSVGLLISAVPLGNRQQRRHAYLAGDWVVHSDDHESTLPPHPPVYASYQKRPQPKPIAALPRIHLKATEEGLTGQAVLPDRLTAGANDDLSKRDPVPLEAMVLEGKTLKFKVKVGDSSISIALSPHRTRLAGTWKATDGTSGKLHLVRYRDLQGPRPR